MGCCGIGSGQVVKPIGGGRQVEQKFEGPIQNRVCRDVIFLILFLGFLGGLGYVFYFYIERGNPDLLIYGMDSYGNVCNQKNKAIPGVNQSGRDTTGLTKLFYFDENMLKNILNAKTNKMDSVAVCVKMCPNVSMSDVTELQRFYSTFQASVCNYDVSSISYVMDGSHCPAAPIKKQTAIFNRCVPDDLISSLERFGEALSSILELFDKDFGKKSIEDVGGTWKEIIYLGLVSLAVSLVMLVMLRFLAAVMVWTVVLLVAVGSMVGAAFCWYSYYKERREIKQHDKEWLGGAIGATFVAFIILLILLVMRKRIKLVIQLFKEAGKAVARMPQLLLQPFFTLIILGGVCAGFVYILLYVITARNPVVDTTNGFVSFYQDDTIKGLVVVYLLGFLWTTQFVLGCERLTVSSAVAMWYFTRNKSKLSSPVCVSVYRLFRFHLGSVAFGSFIIAFVVLIRWILTFIQARLGGSENIVAKFLLKCLICCLWCFEKILKFINSNAYIEIAIHGYGFCKAARTAFLLIVSNVLRVSAINSVGDFTLFLAKAGIVGIVAVVGIELFRDRSDVHYTWLPITLACIFAYFIASCFLGVYEMIIDAIFICFMEDCDMNDGVEKPYFMSLGLMNYVKNSDEAKKEAKQRQKASNVEKF